MRSIKTRLLKEKIHCNCVFISCIFSFSISISISLSLSVLFAITDLPSRSQTSLNKIIRLNWPHVVASMAPPYNEPNHLRLSFSTQHRRRCSKAQMCFFNILHIISVFPAADVPDKKCFTLDEEICENKGLGADHNISLRPPTEIETPATVDRFAKNCVLEKNDRSKSESFVAVEEERATEISDVGDQNSGIDYNEVVVEEEEKHRDEGYLGLLIEAAQLILGDESEQHKREAGRSKEAKRKRQCWTAAAEAEWYAEFEDTSPVVKSKRGRSQVLPYKYRDSVVEPLVVQAKPRSK